MNIKITNMHQPSLRVGKLLLFRKILSLKLIQCLFCTFLLITFSLSHAEQKPRQSEGIVKVVGDFRLLNSAKELPYDIYNQLTSEYKDCPGIADPDEEFNSGCGMGFGGLPCKKMVYAGNVGDVWFIEYLQGGAGLSQTFYAFKVEKERVVSVFVYQQGNPSKKLITTEELVSSLSNKAPECSKKNNYFKYLIENQYGLCAPHEESK